MAAGVLADYRVKRSDRGIAEFERALALDPNRATAHGHIGLANGSTSTGEPPVGPFLLPYHLTFSDFAASLAMMPMTS